MTNKEQIIRNIGLSFDFLKDIVRNPKLLESFADESKIEFVEKDFKKLKRPSDIKKTSFFKIKNSFESV